MHGERGYAWKACLLMAGILVIAGNRDGFGQIGALVSPGQLSQAHASLEGITSCLSCHTAGQGITAQKCLTCHKPVAERIVRKRGVHRTVTTDCVACHVEHAGRGGDLRPFDQRRFNHTTDAGFPLDGLHAAATVTCASCHKGRSFLTASPRCSSCHTDAHKGSLGAQCATCHTTTVAFTDTRKGFDHGRTAFPLTGAHQRATCESCHKSSTYKNVTTSCAGCHQDPHGQKLGTACASCHVTQAWRTAKVDHSRTAFPLKGLHAAVDCAKCHTRPATQVKPASATCATCHADPHKGSFKQDCAACHTEAGFRKGSFDHSTTKFPLVDKHAPLACVACHTNIRTTSPAPVARSAGAAVRNGARPVPTVRPVAPARGAAPVLAQAPASADFRGLHTECVFCHKDVHLAELGTSCEQCHSAKGFMVTTFAHARPRPFFEGGHTALVCAKCHIPQSAPASRLPVGGFTRTQTTCASCHADIHLGQVETACEACHAIDAPKFAVKGFSHDRTAFPLKGKHGPLACETCHKVESRAYPAGAGAARHFKGVGTSCASCHTDKHAGQFTQGCDTCHSVESFKISRYGHLRQSALRDFFRGPHLSATCAACHKAAPTRGGVAAQAVSYKAATSCTSCHTDVHRGALGPRCETCHRL
jgi:hypothetical protein